eukprot:SAG31_NODE_4128_length_3557_cov_1.191440_3_plen_35_part_00
MRSSCMTVDVVGIGLRRQDLAGDPPRSLGALQDL